MLEWHCCGNQIDQDFLVLETTTVNYAKIFTRKCLIVQASYFAPMIWDLIGFYWPSIKGTADPWPTFQTFLSAVFQMLRTNVRKRDKSQYFEKTFDDSPFRAKKGEIFGEFNFGSTVVLVFEAPSEFSFFVRPDGRVRMGEALGHAPIWPWLPLHVVSGYWTPSRAKPIFCSTYVFMKRSATCCSQNAFWKRLLLWFMTKERARIFHVVCYTVYVCSILL